MRATVTTQEHEPICVQQIETRFRLPQTADAIVGVKATGSVFLACPVLNDDRQVRAPSLRMLPLMGLCLPAST